MTCRTALPRPVLLDVDGVLLDSVEFFDGIWRRWARLVGLDEEWVSASARGRRTEDVLSAMTPWLDVAFERRRLDALVAQHLDQIQPIAGARMLLESVQGRPHALVTSGSQWFVERSFAGLGLPLPAVCVYGEDVETGKPAPDCYRLGAQRLGVSPQQCIAVDDSEAGITAAMLAGCAVIGVGDSVPAELASMIEVDTVQNLARGWSLAGRTA